MARDVTTSAALDVAEHQIAEPRDDGRPVSALVETWQARAWRVALGLGSMGKPFRARHIPAFLPVLAREFLTGGRRVPERLLVMEDPWVFSGIARGVGTNDLIAGYRRGFTVGCHVPPLKWWTYDPRAILLLEEAKVAKRFRSILRKSDLRVSFDTDFAATMATCAAPREGQTSLTWITPQIARLYGDLHARGFAHSVETRDPGGTLVGGLFGVGIGRIFVVRSMFHHVPNASKMALYTLHHHLAKWGFRAVDYQGINPMISLMGYNEWPRSDYESLMRTYAQTADRIGRWSIEDDLETIAAGPPKRDITNAFSR
ncbi:MAG: leucyl/phenylalanyl-tRNA--protein transferase [Pseudomonadota bacterium]